MQQKGVRHVDVAEDGLLALNAVAEKGVDFYDLIFMDNTMPNMVSLCN
jgi:CheY-like chemotaxis protein